MAYRQASGAFTAFERLMRETYPDVYPSGQCNTRSTVQHRQRVDERL